MKVEGLTGHSLVQPPLLLHTPTQS